MCVWGGGEKTCTVEAVNLVIRLARTWRVLSTKLRALGLVVCVLQLWDGDLGALWACPMNKCEYDKNCPSSSQLSRS